MLKGLGLAVVTVADYESVLPDIFHPLTVQSSTFSELSCAIKATIRKIKTKKSTIKSHACLFLPVNRYFENQRHVSDRNVEHTTYLRP